MAADTITWYDADGGLTNLTDWVNYAVLWGAHGDYAPYYLLTEIPLPQQPGNYLANTRIDARQVDMPLLIQGATADALLTNVRYLLARLDPTRGDGRLRVTRPDGSARELTCRCITGLNNSSLDTDTDPSLGYVQTTLLFRANDPLWYASSPVTQTWTGGTLPVFFPFFPLALAGGTTFSAATVVNGGDEFAWPVWTITGPATSVVLANTTSGKSMTVTYTLSAGDTLVIDTRPGVKTVMSGAGVNVWATGALSVNSALWPLLRGSNTLSLTLNGSSVGSSIGLVYYPCYLSR